MSDLSIVSIDIHAENAKVLTDCSIIISPEILRAQVARKHETVTTYTNPVSIMITNTWNNLVLPHT